MKGGIIMLEIIIWLLIAFVVIVIDIVTSSFIFMWFSIGAIAAIILSSTRTMQYGVQILIFLDYWNCYGMCWISMGKEKI